jgi:AAA+ superfamily predicted ATPase
MQHQNVVPGKNLLKNIEQIGLIASAFKGDPRKIDQQDPDILALSDFLKISPMQALVFSVIFILNFKNRNVDIDDLSGYMETTNLKILPLLTEIEILEKKKLISRYNSSNRMSELRRSSIFEISYFITRKILNAILNNDYNLLARQEKYSMVSLLEEISLMIEDHDDGNLSYEELVTETNYMLQNNQEQDFLRRLNSFHLNMENLLMILFICRETLNGSPACDLVRTCEKIFDDVDTRFRMRKSLITGNNDLIIKGLLKLQDGFFKTDREILLTDKAIHDLFGKDSDMIKRKDQSRKELIRCENLKETRLFFNMEEQENLEFITRNLQQTNYMKTVRRMKKMNMASGIAILFHGHPGTGKTASVNEIARKTGRDIFKVDISNTKSMWFGESEKVIKELFDRYRRIVENSDKAPILLFNECDAVFSTRKEIGSSPVDQTENAIQNIILQEIESLKGIMIATTNLTKNLDPAFERRFLFKIEFHKPGPKVLQKIWIDKIPVLKAPEVKQLSERFDLSGGNIENIARKVQMHQILTGVYPCFDRMLAFCAEEQMVKSNRKRVGYMV